MTKLTLNLAKPGDAKPAALSLNLTKAERFTVKLLWDGDADVDLHALLCLGTASTPPALTQADQILSCYNLAPNGVLPKQADGRFALPGGALVHSADARDGRADGVDEYIEIDPAKIPLAPGQTAEVPLIAMLHPGDGSKRFRQVQNARVEIVNSSGQQLLLADLSAQFANAVGVQMGTIMLQSGLPATFSPVGVGFEQDFNQVLASFQ
ncbi:hypothetical protein GT347_22385 [Xylophilus rhododendri]|uniref:TerD domain-containing protein n=1 Tax=Xylophilus rhododendri TaxID=2697032 RepID=A0A857JBM6_9BURK|nr:TerD family protein [Xylophilus rhododendri]QHJ00480.1 hypothetical protein GT347_22385 [Xylophilus rhododendri]